MPDTDMMPLRSELVALRRSLARLEQQAGLEPSPLAVPSTGYRLVNPGDIVQADDHNMVMGQSVPRFASVAARDAAWVGPPDGAMCKTMDTHTLWHRRSGAWSQAVPGTRTTLTPVSPWVAVDAPGGYTLDLYYNGSCVVLEGTVKRTSDWASIPTNVLAAGAIPANMLPNKATYYWLNPSQNGAAMGPTFTMSVIPDGSLTANVRTGGPAFGSTTSLALMGVWIPA